MTLFIVFGLLFFFIIVGFMWMFSDGANWGIAVGLSIWFSIGIFIYWYSFGTEEYHVFKVEDKERIAEGNDGKWMVYADDGTTYENTDAWFHGKVNATDLFRDLKVGRSYRCLVNGVRFGLTSNYQNLLRCTDLKTGEELRY